MKHRRTSISLDSNSHGNISSRWDPLVPLRLVVLIPARLGKAKVRKRQAQYGTVRWCSLVTCRWSSVPCHPLFRFSRPAPLCRIHSLGWAPSGQGPPLPSPNQLPSTNGHPITHPPLVPRTPAAVVFSRSDCRCHKTVHPSDPIVIRYQVTYWFYSPDQGLFSLAPLVFLIICHHRPRPRGGLARSNPLPVASTTPPWRVESRAPGRRNSLLARLAQLARLSITDLVSATTLAAVSAAPAAPAVGQTIDRLLRRVVSVSPTFWYLVPFPTIHLGLGSVLFCLF